jgi:L-2-hydroxyglutarate oxidase LhgO
MANANAAKKQETDVLLIGGGIMSATLGTYLQELQPDWSMTMVERLDGVAQESSNGWNNAGTGHSALMELNYTPQKKDGSISIEKAVEINEAFQISPVLVTPGEQRCDARSALLHQYRAAHELCVGRSERQLPARALRGLTAEHAVPR